MQENRLGGRLWRGLGTLAMLSLLVVAGCGGNNTVNPGYDLGSGTLLAFIGADGNLQLARADGSSAHAVTVTPCPSTVNCYGPPSWSPDGQLVAVFGPSQGTPSINSIYIFNRAGLLQHTLHPANPQAFGNVLWSGDGKTVAYAGDLNATNAAKGSAVQFALTIIDAATGSQTGVINLPSPTGGNAQCTDVSRGAQLGAALDLTINGNSGIRATLDWSPDGSHVLSSGGNCSTQVMLVDHGGNAHLLPAVTANAQQAAFSPDGQHIIATEDAISQDNLLLYDATGGSGKIIYSNSDAVPAFAPRISSPEWSADGSHIYFMHGADLWIVKADGTGAQQLIAGVATGDPMKAETDPQPSPDGKLLAWDELTFSTVDSIAHITLFVGDSAGKNQHAVQSGGIWPAWS